MKSQIFFTLILGVIFLLGLLALLFWYFGTSLNTDTAQIDTAMQAEQSTSTGIHFGQEHVEFSDGSEATFSLAEPFTLTVAGEGLGKPRFMAMSPDGRLFVPDLVDYRLSPNGHVYILDDFDESTGVFQKKHTYLSGLRGANSVAFYTDSDDTEWLYLALTEHLLRYRYHRGDTAPTESPEIVLTFPNTQTSGETSVVWHITRTIVFHDDTLYVSIGSGCNACEHEQGELRGMILVAEPDGSRVRVYANGLRNAVGLTWAGDTLYATENGVDHLGPNAPNDVLYQIHEGVHYGWPYCYEKDGDIVEDTVHVWTEPVPCGDVPRAYVVFEPHSAPLGITYFENAHPLLQQSFLVALHGSFDPTLRAGYRVVRISKDGSKDIFMEGFLNSDAEQIGRPVHFLQKNANSFFMTDDYTGSVYYIHATS